MDHESTKTKQLDHGTLIYAFLICLFSYACWGIDEYICIYINMNIFLCCAELRPSLTGYVVQTGGVDQLDLFWIRKNHVLTSDPEVVVKS